MIDQLQYVSQKPENGTHLNAIHRVLDAGGRWIQLRVKDLPKIEILKLAVQARKLCNEFSAKLIVNDHPDVALQAEADGLHLGLSDMSVPEARLQVGCKLIIGGTANTYEDVLRRIEDGVDYIGLGPFRFTTTKKNLSPVLGLHGYTEIMMKLHQAGISVPVIAIGGIGLSDVAVLKQTGIHGVALSTALTNQPNLDKRVKSLYSNLDHPGQININLQSYNHVKNS